MGNILSWLLLGYGGWKLWVAILGLGQVLICLPLFPIALAADYQEKKNKEKKALEEERRLNEYNRVKYDVLKKPDVDENGIPYL